VSDELEKMLESAIESPGVLLKAAREAEGISIEEMASRLNWLKSYVVAIEEDRFDVFSSQTFAKGYLRSYGKRLGITEKRLLENYSRLIKGTNAGELPRKQVEVNLPSLDGGNIGKYVGLLAFFLLVTLLWWMKIDQSDLSEDSFATIGTQPTKGDPGVETTSPAHDAAQSVKVIADMLEDDVKFITSSEATDQPVDNMTSEKRRSVDPVAPTILYFNFPGECWLEVRDSSNELIHADLHRKGEKLAVSGVPPFEVLVGQADAVELVYMGKAIQFEPQRGRNSVRRRVGE
jgi:cytoskeleton protein RodZ